MYSHVCNKLLFWVYLLIFLKSHHFNCNTLLTSAFESNQSISGNCWTELIQSDRAGTVRQSWYSQIELMQSDRAGTLRQSWYSQTELVQSDRAGTLRQSWYSQTELVHSDRADTVR